MLTLKFFLKKGLKLAKAHKNLKKTGKKKLNFLNLKSKARHLFFGVASSLSILCSTSLELLKKGPWVSINYDQKNLPNSMPKLKFLLFWEEKTKSNNILINKRKLLYEIVSKNLHYINSAKGRLISKRNFGVFKYTKKPTKFL